MCSMMEKYKLAQLEVKRISDIIDKGGLSFELQLEYLVLHELAIKNLYKVDREYKNYLGIDLK